MLSQFKQFFCRCLPPEKNISTFLRRFFFRSDYPWGAWSLVSLYISIVSGILVGLQYDYHTPYYSSTSIELIVPFGGFFRSLHFYSSQFFFFLTCIHLIAAYKAAETYKQTDWLRLIIVIPVIILLLFTGYILRADNTGESAGLIAESIAKTIPILGNLVNSFFLSLADSGLRKVYIHHVITLDFLLLLLLWKHLRKYRVTILNHLGVIGVTLLFSLLISAPIDPEKLGTTYISGPWFFLGLQELLRYTHPFIAGVIVPCALVLLLLLARPTNKHAPKILKLFACSAAGYTLLSLIALCR